VTPPDEQVRDQDEHAEQSDADRPGKPVEVAPPGVEVDAHGNRDPGDGQ
jgi:hypothetical protein